MFTGLIEEVGIIESVAPVSNGIILTIRATLATDGLNTGDSVAVNGICLTVAHRTESTFSVTAVRETLNRSAIEQIRSGDAVNLERAMRLSDRLDGHIVQGHVDGRGRLLSIRQTGAGWMIDVQLPDALKRYVVEKGSIAMDGISLTVAALHDGRIGIAAIPHTYQNTNLKFRKTGDLVNIETDLIGKYVERMIGARPIASSYSENWYRSQGY